MVATPLLRNCNDMKLYLFLSKKNIGIEEKKKIKKKGGYGLGAPLF